MTPGSVCDGFDRRLAHRVLRISSTTRTQITNLPNGFFAARAEAAMRSPRRPVAFDAVDVVPIVAEFVPFLAVVVLGTVAMRLSCVIALHLELRKASS